MKHLIVNADDFGHSAEVNAGVIEAHERGIVTSASLMVLRPAAGDAVAYARSHPKLSLGLHVELGEWAHQDGNWMPLYEVDEEDVAHEVARQLERFRVLCGRDPTHLDSHQHVHRREPARSVLLRLAQELGVPVRHFDPHVRYCGDFYGQTERGEPLPQAITPEALICVLISLPIGMTELCCHPGKGEIPGSSYGPEREQELAALCDRRVRAAIESAGIKPRSFEDLA